MRTAYAQSPRSSHKPKVVDKSLAVNRESRFDAPFATYACERSIDGLDALRDFDDEPFAVTLHSSPLVEDCPSSQAKEVRHAPVSRAGCTVNEGYQKSGNVAVSDVTLVVERHRARERRPDLAGSGFHGRCHPFAVTVNGRVVMMPAPPSIPALIIPAGHLLGIPADYAKDITPKEYVQ